MNNPALDFCLLIPCYNNFEGLIQSLKSVSYPAGNYLIVVVDDGSAEPLQQQQIDTCLLEKKPVVILRQEINSGITKALNRGLAWIGHNTSSKYIARLDCGDVCTADRFTLQAGYMDQHPATCLVGSWCMFEEKATRKGYAYTTPIVHEKIMRGMYFRNLFIHPTMMFRVSALARVGYYSEDFPHAEDYALVWELMHTGDTYIIPKYLVTCEINIKGISHKNRRAQLRSRYHVIRKYGSPGIRKWLGYLQLFLLYLVPKELILHLKKLR